MTFLPVVAREMGVLARRKSMYWSRWVTAVLALLVMLWLLAVSASQVSFAELGRSIFLILSSLCFTFAALVGMQATSDCVSEEKREGTLGLLFLTDLKGRDVIGGKFVVSSMHAVLVLIGVIPMLSLALLLGGVTLRQFGLVALVLLNTMFLSLALGVCVSCFSKNERKAMVGTFVGLFLVILGPFVIGILLQSYLGFPEELLAISPLYAFTTLHSNPARMVIAPLYFWHSLVLTHVLAWGFLIVAARVLPRFVNEIPSPRFERLRNFVNEFVYGRIEDRKRHRAALLDRNAFLWLASRERVKTKYAWGIIAFFLGLYLWIALQFDNMLFDVAVSVSIMVLIHAVFKIWAASEVCSRLIQDRRSGALELLLSTPLSVQAIAEGQSAALRRIFFKPIIVLLGLEAVLLLGGLTEPRQMVSKEERIMVFATVIGTFLLDLWALKWVGLWLSLTGKSIERVLLTTVTRVLVLPWLIFAIGAGLLGLKLAATGSLEFSQLVFGWGMINVVVSVFLGGTARQNFLTQFRELAAKRFEAAPEPEPRKVEKAKGMTSAGRRWSVPAAFQRSPVRSSLFLGLFLFVFIAWARGFYWKHRLESEIGAIRAAKFPVTMTEVERFYPSPMVEQNAFAMLAKAGAPSWQGRPLVNPRIRKNGRPLNAEEMKRAELDQAIALVAANSKVLSAMWKLPEYRRAHFDMTVFDIWTHQFHHAGYAAVLEADVIARSRQSQPVETGSLVKSIRALLAHARLLRMQPLVFAQHCAGESLRRLASTLDEVLEQNLLSEEMLNQLQADLDAVNDNPKVLERVLAIQRASFLEPLAPGIRMPMMGMAVVRTAPGVNYLDMILNATGSSEKLKVQVLSDYREAMQLVGRSYHAQGEAINRFQGRWMEVMKRDASPLTGGMPSIFGSIEEAFRAEAVFTVHWQLIKMAVAAERFQMRHRMNPSKAEVLVPEFLSEIPQDPYSGEAMRSVRRGDELFLYSVGLGGRDETESGDNDQVRDDIVFSFR